MSKYTWAGLTSGDPRAIAKVNGCAERAERKAETLERRPLDPDDPEDAMFLAVYAELGMEPTE